MLEKICSSSEKLFMRYGIKSITMDDVAKELSISKKTIYQYVSDKDDLVNKTILLHIQSMDHGCMKVVQSEENAILQIIKIAEMMISMHKEMNPSVLFDLKKYHPDTYKMFTDHREKSMMTEVIGNLNLGISQKLYRENLNIPVTAGVYMVLIESCISTDVQSLATLSFADKYNHLIDYHFNAICTPKGLEFIKNYKSQKTTNNI